MPRSIILLVLIVIIAIGALFFLSSRAREVEPRPMEVDVTNAVGR